GYIVRAVEKAPEKEISVERPGTQPQRKLGRNIDTYLGAHFLAEALAQMPNLPEKKRVKNALQNLVARTERAQKADGSYAADGWGPVLPSPVANKGLESAERAGAKVDVNVSTRGDPYMLNNYDAKTKTYRTPASAGVWLYAVAGAAKSAVRSKRT